MQFGKRFAAELKQPIKDAGVWKAGGLIRISYTDRYLNAPLPMLLFLRTCEALAAELKAGDSVDVDVTVQPLKKDRSPYRIFDDWENEDDRKEVAHLLGGKFGLDVGLQVTTNADHGRKLMLGYDDGQKVLILLDQGLDIGELQESRRDTISAPLRPRRQGISRILWALSMGMVRAISRSRGFDKITSSSWNHAWIATPPTSVGYWFQPLRMNLPASGRSVIQCEMVLRLARMADWPEGLRSLPSLNHVHWLQEASGIYWPLDRAAGEAMMRSTAI